MASLAAERCSRVSVGTNVGRDNILGIATRYPLDRPEIKIPAKTRYSPKRPDGSWGPPSLLYNGYRVSFPGGKAAGVEH
jgi:hypothetical protein